MKRVCIYKRVSSEGQAKEDKTSLEEQERRCRDWLDKLGGYQVVAVESDGGVSGGKLHRPAFDRVIERARNGEIDAVIVAKVDRYARDNDVSGVLSFTLNQYGVELMIVDRDLTTPQGRMLVHMEGGWAEWERSIIRDRLTTGRYNKVKKGTLIGSSFTAYGYDYSKDSKSYILNETESGWARQIFEWIGIEGMSMSAVARRLNDLGVPTKRKGKGWVSSTVKQMIDNPVYYGQFTYFKNKATAPIGSRGIGSAQEDKTSHVRRDQSEWVGTEVPAIVSKELWDACQQAKERNTIQSKRNGKLDYLLRAGMLVCNLCGSIYHGTTSHNRRVYRCNGIKPSYILKAGKRCGSSTVRADEIEAKVWTKIVRRLESLSSVESLFAGESEEEKLQRERDEISLLAIVSQENEIDAEEEKLVTLYMRNAVSDAIYDVKKADLEKRRSGIATLKAEIAGRLQAREHVIADAEALTQLTQSASRLHNATFTHKRKVLELLRTKVTINADGSLDIDGLITDHVLAAVSFYAEMYEDMMSEGAIVIVDGKQIQVEESDVLDILNGESFFDPIYGTYRWQEGDGDLIKGIQEPVKNAMAVQDHKLAHTYEHHRRGKRLGVCR